MAIVAPSATAGTAAAVEPGDPFLFLEFAWVDAATIQAKVAASAPTTAARILMFDSSGDLKWFSFTGTQSIAITTDGVNGLETVCLNAEGEETDHNYHVYAVGKADGTVGFILTDTDDFSAGPFTGWSMPTGYTYCSAPAWYVRNDGSGNIMPFHGSGGLCTYLGTGNNLTVLLSGTATTYTDITAGLRVYVPEWATDCVLSAFIGDNEYAYITPDSTYDTIYLGPEMTSTDVTYPANADLFYKKTSSGSSFNLWAPRWRR